MYTEVLKSGLAPYCDEYLILFCTAFTNITGKEWANKILKFLL